MRHQVVIAFVVLMLFSTSGSTSGREDDGPGGGVSGYVTRHGFPVPARVELRRKPAGDDLESPLVLLGPPLAVVSPDERGVFRFDRLEPGTYELRAIAEGAIDFRSFEVERPGHRLTVRLSPAPMGPVVAGRAVWADGAPFHGTVSSQTGVVATDHEGAFALTTGARHERRIVLFEKGRIRRSIVVPTDGQVVVDAGLVPSAGRILAADLGVPLAGARLPKGPPPGHHHHRHGRGGTV